MLLSFDYRKKVRLIRYYHNKLEPSNDIHILIENQINELNTVQTYLNEDASHYLTEYNILNIQKNVGLTLCLSIINNTVLETLNKLKQIKFVTDLKCNKQYKNQMLLCIEHETHDIIVNYPVKTKYIN